ncbi:laccase [Rhodotorula diobovata]|uniref:Laccase n=1 Tax=Rhodotorula diobovata TaxID=5288 RepID=A0A5C5FXH7_9BASI|nr:laccase [Rhodotorula diobovata]
MRAGLSALAVLALASSASADLVEKWYNITYTKASPDGFEKDWVVGVNGTWPPPILNVKANDTVRIHALNNLDMACSIHHHGIFFNQTNYYDGAPGITQCPIPPGAKLTYEVPVDLQHGTYWWHSHSSVAYQDGLRAPFIIHAENEPHQYDDEFTIILGDWYHERGTKLNNKFMSKYNPTGAEPVPDALLMYAADQNGTYLPSNENVQFNGNLSIPFEAGKTYRLRVLNTGVFAMTFFWIDGHEMQVIEADGVDTEPYPVDFLTVSVAQRYSVLVTARNDTSQNWLVHANFDDSMFDTVPEGLTLNYTTTISYGEGNPTAPSGYRDQLGLMEDHLMVPIVAEEQYVPTTELELDVYFDAYDNGVNRASMLNNVTWVAPDTPSLMTMLSMGNDSLNSKVYGPQTAQHILNRGEVMDLMVINFDANAHPFHLHGFNFQVTRVATDVTSSDPLLNPPHTLGAANPMRRDTIIVPAGGAVNIAWQAYNPGAWVFHCHIQWHMEAGLAVVFMTDVLGAQQSMTLPQEIVDQCEAQGISPTGNAAGKMSLTDFAGAPSGPDTQEHITGWTPKAKGALAGCVLTAIIGMITVVWYAVGGQLDADELNEEVHREMAAKAAAGGGLLKRGFKAVTGKKGGAAE